MAKKLGMMAAGVMMLSALAATVESIEPSSSIIPRPSIDASSAATLTPKQWKKRKRRNQLAKASRKQNRK